MFSSSGRRVDRVTVLFLSLVAVGFIIATFDVRSPGGGASDVLREGAQSLFTPMQQGVDWVTRPVVGFIDGFANLAGMREENERLADRVRELEDQADATEALEEQIIQFEAILGLEIPGDLATVPARINASGPSVFDNVRFIDKGATDGIVSGQAVVDEDGLVGRVDLVSANSARIRLLTDQFVSVSVRVLSTNETGIVTGKGDGPLRLEMFRAKEGVSAGDRVVTDGSRFPPGILVGVITENADAEVGFVLRTDVDPSVMLSQIDFVQVVVGWSPIDAALQEHQDGPLVVTTTLPTTTTTGGEG